MSHTAGRDSTTTCAVTLSYRAGAGAYHRLNRVGRPARTNKIERGRFMAEIPMPAPDKDQPHTFEAGPEVPAAYTLTEGPALPDAGGANCSLCGAPRAAQIHLEGKAEADSESPRWGL